MGVNEIFFGEPAGLILLELKGDEKQRLLLEKDLKALKTGARQDDGLLAHSW